MGPHMPRVPRLKLPKLKLKSNETIGQRIARLRKDRGYTQVALARKMGLIQSLVSDYERGVLRPHGEMVIRFALALRVSADELLGLASPERNGEKLPLRFMRRLREAQKLPLKQQRMLLNTMDVFIKAAKGG